jgi:hypothetical protein
VADQSVDQLRSQLRDRGYLTHGIERWFALDPLVSRTFWVELTIVAAKAAALIAAFGILPLVAIMVLRNHPLSATETLLIAALYALAWAVGAFAFIVAVALLLKLRPELAVDTPRALLGIGLASAALLVVPIVLWWFRFETFPSLVELAVGTALVVLFFVTASIVVSAAMLSFSVYELRRVPAIHQKSRTLPMAIAAVVLMGLLFVPAYGAKERGAVEPPAQVVTSPTARRVALVAVDGLTYDIFRSRPPLAGAFVSALAMPRMGGRSATERWASLGTGVGTAAHGVRAIEGVRFRNGRHLIQSLSRDDFVLRDVAEWIGLASRRPLPPTVRRRDYIWEIFAARGVPSVAVNWWTTESAFTGALDTIGQQTVFSAAHGDAVKVDRIAAWHLIAAIDRNHPQFATVYLPALDVVMNRLELDGSQQLAASVQALDGVAAVVAELKRRGFDTVLVGLPGDRQSGRAVMASTFRLPATRASAFDLAPTLCAALGFPPSAEMPGHSLIGGETARVATYGTRRSATAAPAADQEYYRNLKSLGYIR